MTGSLLTKVAPGFSFSDRQSEEVRAIPAPHKKQAVDALRQAASEARSIYLTEFTGLSVAEASEVRGLVLEAGGRIRVVKNRLFRLALQGTGYEPLTEYLMGPNAAIFCGDDPIGPLKALTEFAQQHEMAPVKVGMVEGAVVGAEGVQELAKLPGRDGLVALVVGAVAWPINDFVLTLNGVVSEIVYTLQAVAEKLGGEEAA